MLRIPSEALRTLTSGFLELSPDQPQADLAAPSETAKSRTVPSPLLLALIAMGSLLWPLALLVPAGWAAGALFWLILLALVGVHYQRLPTSSNFECSRDLPKRFSLGSIQTVRLRLKNLSELPVLFELQDDCPDALEALEAIPQGELSPNSEAEFSYRARSRRRGEHRFESLLLRFRFPGGLLERRIAFQKDDRIKVYPRFLESKEYELLAKIDERDEIVRRPRRVRGVGTDFESLRQYVPGDDIRKIDWKASARRNRLITRVYQVEKGQQLSILIDCGRLMAGRIGEMPRLEHALNAAVMLSYVAQKRGDSVSVATFSNRIESFLPPTRGRLILPSVLENLYRTEVRRVESDYWQVIAEAMAMLKKRSLVFMMTDVLDTTSSSGLIANLFRASAKHLVLCVVLDEPRVEETADMIPETLTEAYGKSAAAHLVLERHMALERLRSHGILVLESAPENLSIQLVRRYLDIRQANLQ